MDVREDIEMSWEIWQMSFIQYYYVAPLSINRVSYGSIYMNSQLWLPIHTSITKIIDMKSLLTSLAVILIIGYFVIPNFIQKRMEPLGKAIKSAFKEAHITYSEHRSKKERWFLLSFFERSLLKASHSL